MKILKLLSKIILPILVFFLFSQNSFSEEPVDIWNIEKQQNNENKHLEKLTVFFVKKHPVKLDVLLLDFNTLIIQKIIKINCFLYKKTIKKLKDVSKKTSVFIKNTTFVFLPQQTLKQ